MFNQTCLIIPELFMMPIIGLGTWQTTGMALEKSIETALEAGYRLIDTAVIYGNEEVIGKVVKKWIDQGKLRREDIFITTKLPPNGMRPEGVDMYLRSSLDKLQMEYVDLFLIHVPFGFNYVNGEMVPLTKNGVVDLDEKTDHLPIWKAMEQTVYKNLTKSIGLSNFNITQMKNILSHAKIPPVNLQVELHVFNQEKDLVKFCKRNKITVTSYSTFASPGSKGFFDSIGINTYIPDVFSNVVVKRIAKKHKKTPGQVLLRYMVQKGIAVIPKSNHPKRIRENFNIFNFSLDRRDMKALNDLDATPPIRVVDMTMFPGVKQHPLYPW